MPDGYFSGGEQGGSPAFVVVEQGAIAGVDVVLGAGAPAQATVRAEPSVPNPFRDAVAIRLMTDRARAPITIDLYAVNGRLVRRLTAESDSPGLREVQWDGREADGGLAPSGVYVYRATVADKIVSGRLVLIR